MIAYARSSTRARLIYFSAAVVVACLGLASRKYAKYLPDLLGEYAGDTLWALMLFLLVSSLLDGKTPIARTAISLTLAFLVEFSQLYHAPWIEAIRQTTLGGLVLGQGFLWTDLLCYSLGIAIGLAIESTFS